MTNYMSLILFIPSKVLIDRKAVIIKKCLYIYYLNEDHYEQLFPNQQTCDRNLHLVWQFLHNLLSHTLEFPSYPQESYLKKKENEKKSNKYTCWSYTKINLGYIQ